jgi:hypothetical protein
VAEHASSAIGPDADHRPPAQLTLAPGGLHAELQADRLAFQQVGADPRFRTARGIIGDLNEHGVKCAAGSADLSPADAPIAVNAEHGCTVDRRQVRIVIVAATDRLSCDRYLRWLTEQGGGGGYFALGDGWGVGGDFEWLARRVQQAIGGRVCALSVADGTCAPLDVAR